MAKKESRGQKVKTFKHWIPQPDLSREETQVAVYFKADEGTFYIYHGAHVFEACQDEAGNMYHFDKVHMRPTSISGKVMDQVVKAFEAVCNKYEKLLREQGKIRVIRFSFARNRRYVEDSPFKPASDISFCGSPALHFDYELLWRVGDKLYRQDAPDFPLQFAGSVARDRGLHGEDETCVDWTPEREAFFEQMRNGLITLINRIEDFQSDLAGNIDLAIASGGMFLLAAPVKEPVE